MHPTRRRDYHRRSLNNNYPIFFTFVIFVVVVSVRIFDDSLLSAVFALGISSSRYCHSQLHHPNHRTIAPTTKKLIFSGIPLTIGGLISARPTFTYWQMIPRGGANHGVAAAAAEADGSGSAGLSLLLSFNNAPLWQAQKVLLAANALGYLLTIVTKSHYHVDLLGTGAFALAAWPSLFSSIPRIQWSAGLVATWSIKLAFFLFYRVLQSGHDSRLDATLDRPVSAAGFWMFSWAWGALCSLPLTVGSTSSLPGHPLLVRMGAIMAATGLIVETLADYQKWNFKRQQGNNRGHCNVGLWNISQHPNWFGNLVFWCGIVVMNVSALVEPAVAVVAKENKTQQQQQHWLHTMGNVIWRWRRVGDILAGPAFMWFLFSGQATGRILPDAVASYKQRYGCGTNPAFTDYVDHTPLIIPNLLHIFTGKSSIKSHSRSE